jgi:hypothetical protein
MIPFAVFSTCRDSIKRKSVFSRCGVSNKIIPDQKGGKYKMPGVSRGAEDFFEKADDR